MSVSKRRGSSEGRFDSKFATTTRYHEISESRLSARYRTPIPPTPSLPSRGDERVIRGRERESERTKRGKTEVDPDKAAEGMTTTKKNRRRRHVRVKRPPTVSSDDSSAADYVSKSFEVLYVPLSASSSRSDGAYDDAPSFLDDWVPFCRLCNHRFSEPIDLETHYLSPTHKRQALRTKHIREYLHLWDPDLLKPPEPVVDKAKKVRPRTVDVLSLKSIEYGAKIHVIETRRDLTRLCEEVATMFSPSVLPFVGFDAERLTPTPLMSHNVVLVQICFSPHCVVVIAIHKIVEECGGVFPRNFLHFLRRFVLVGVKVGEDVHDLATTYNLVADYTKRVTKSTESVLALNFLELNEIGSRVFGPRCSTGTWGLQSLFERVDPGYTIPKDSFLRRSDWSRSLTLNQLRYAATDAAASLFVFHELVNSWHRDKCRFYSCRFYLSMPCDCAPMQTALSKILECFELS